MANGAVILDVDGTLVDSNDAHAQAWVEAFAEHGIAVPFNTVRRAIGMGGDKLMPHVAGISEQTTEGQRISQRRGEIFRQKYLPHLQPFQSVRDLLERFVADDLTLAVASSAEEGELNALLDIAGVTDLLTSRTSSDDAERSKPDPDIVQTALKQTGCKADRTLMLGDTPYDVEAAARTGVGIVAVECGGWSSHDLHGALTVYQSPADLLRRYDDSPFARIRSLFARTS